jgi:hypothetical protein
LLSSPEISLPELVAETVYPDRFRVFFQINNVTVPQIGYGHFLAYPL